MGKVLAISNRKGGCAKSFTTANLGVGLARRGKKVLCIDADNQYSLTVSLGVTEPDKLPVSLKTIISDIIAMQEINSVQEIGSVDITTEKGIGLAGEVSASGGIDKISGIDYADDGDSDCADSDNSTKGIIHHPEGIDLMPANNSLTGIETSLATLMGRENILRQYIEKVRPLYDYCLIDTSPTFDMLTINALSAADEVIIPVTPKFLDAKGLELLLKSIAQIRRNINPQLSICGILKPKIKSLKKPQYADIIIAWP